MDEERKFFGVEEEEEEEETFQASDPNAALNGSDEGNPGEGDGGAAPADGQSQQGNDQEDEKALLEYARKVKSYEKEHNVAFDQLVPEFTRRSQRLAELEKEGGAPAKPGFREEMHTPSEEEVALQQKLRAQGFLTREDVELRERVQEEAQQLDATLKGYVEKYSFIDPIKVLEKMQEFAPTSVNEENLKAAIMAVHSADFEKHWQEQALAKKTPNANLSRGSQGVVPPQGEQKPKTWDDVEKSMIDRLEAGDAQNQA